MGNKQTDQALALAGVFQAAYLVQEIAYHGRVADEVACEATLASIFAMGANSADAVYRGPASVQLGLKVLRDQIRGPDRARNMELTKYVVALLHLERRLMRNPSMAEHLREGLEAAAKQADYFGSSAHETIVAKLAELYAETISTLGPRIMVSGEHHHLANTDKANLIRALLLAGIRAAVLWRQSGGRRWQLLLGRRRLLSQAERLLKATAAPEA